MISRLLNALLVAVIFLTLAVASGRAYDQSFVLREGAPEPTHSGVAGRTVARAGDASESAAPSLSTHVSVWIRMADCESGDGDGLPPYRASWAFNGLHDGGLQFVPSTWRAAKRLSEVRSFAYRYAYAYQAPAWVQIAVADNWRRHTSWAQWPTCSRKLGLR